MAFQEEWLADFQTKGEKWEYLQARCTPDEKREIFLYCKGIIKLPYSVITRLIWRRILHNHRIAPQLKNDEIKETERAVDEILVYIPAIKNQFQIAKRIY